MYKTKPGIEVFVLLELSDVINVGLLVKTMADYIEKDYKHALDANNMFTNYIWSEDEVKTLISDTLASIYKLETSGERVGFKLWMKNSKFFKGVTDVEGTLNLLFKPANAVQ